MPVRALLYHKKLTSNELKVLQAMLEIGDSTGQLLYPSIPRIAAYAKVSRRTVQNVLHGDHRNKTKLGLIPRGVLTEIAPANATKRRSATYRLNIEVLEDDVETERYRQNKLPFPADEIELEKWIRRNEGAWSQIKRELRNAAEARVGAPPLSQAASAAFMISVARQYGMPHRLAQLCVKVSRQ